MIENVKYDVPDVEPDEATGLSVWSVMADGEEVGRVVETERGYRAETPVQTFPERPFRSLAIRDITGEDGH
jgi:hypothetical protein